MNVLNRFQILSFVISAFQLKSFKVSLLWKTFNQNCLKRKFATQPAGNNIVKMQNSAKSVEYFSQPFFIEMHFLITYHEFWKYYNIMKIIRNKRYNQICYTSSWRSYFVLCLWQNFIYSYENRYWEIYWTNLWFLTKNFLYV